MRGLNPVRPARHKNARAGKGIGIEPQSGMTLIELLVSIVILGFVVSIMSGAFFQIAQVVRVAENANGQFQSSWLQGRALIDLVGNLALPQEARRPFSGDSREFEGYTLHMPNRDWGQVQAFKAKLVARQSGGTDLVISGEDEQSLVLASWDEPVQFEYLATDGVAHMTWPSFDSKSDLVPSGVMVKGAYGKQIVHLIVPYTGTHEIQRDAQQDAMKLFGGT